MFGFMYCLGLVLLAVWIKLAKNSIASFELLHAIYRSVMAYYFLRNVIKQWF